MPDPNHPHSSTTAAPPRFPAKPVAAALLPVAAWGLMSRLDGDAAGHPFIFMLLPVLLASWWGGPYAGIAASLLAVLGAWDLATPGTPLLDLGTGGQPVDLLGALSLATAGAVVTLMHETLRRRTRRTLDAEQQAHAQRQSLEARDDIFNETNDLIQSVAADGQILYANRSWCETLGYTREELPALNIFQIIHDGCRDHCMTAFGRLMQGENIGIIQVSLVAKDGHVTELEGNVSARMENGVMVSSRGIFRDISARKQAEAALEESLQKLKRSNTELEQFAYVASHDLQEPLRAISGCVQILEKNYAEKLDANAVELIRHTVEGTARMQSLINDLLAYSRVIQQSSALVPVDFETILSGALVNLEVTIAETGAVVTHDPLPTVLADATQCTQLLQNLIGNAIKFHGQATPQVHVSAERKGALWQFAIRDNGIGIQEQYFDRIFTIFQRLHTREHYLGTGIGLAICQKVVEGCGGRIWLESTPGQGTTFFFTLPHSNQKART